MDLSLMAAATLLLHQAVTDADGRDVPVATGLGPFDARGLYCLGAALMDLALRGRVRLDLSTAATPLARARGGVGTATIASFVLGLGLSSALAFTGHPGAAMPVGAGAMVCFGGLIFLGNRARDRGRGYLRVVDRSPTGDAALDELLVLMMGGRARSVQRWLLVTRTHARSVQAKAERVLFQLGCMVWTGPQRSILGTVDTFVMDRSEPAWQGLSRRLRATLVDGQPPDLLVSALLIWLTLLPATFTTPKHLQLPGQPPGRTMAQGIQLVVAEHELPAVRTRLQGVTADYDVASALGADLYGTLLGIRQGVMDAIESLRSR